MVLIVVVYEAIVLRTPIITIRRRRKRYYGFLLISIGLLTFIPMAMDRYGLRGTSTCWLTGSPEELMVFVFSHSIIAAIVGTALGIPVFVTLWKTASKDATLFSSESSRVLMLRDAAIRHVLVCIFLQYVAITGALGGISFILIARWDNAPNSAYVRNTIYTYQAFGFITAGITGLYVALVYLVSYKSLYALKGMVLKIFGSSEGPSSTGIEDTSSGNAVAYVSVSTPKENKVVVKDAPLKSHAYSNAVSAVSVVDETVRTSNVYTLSLLKYVREALEIDGLDVEESEISDFIDGTTTFGEDETDLENDSDLNERLEAAKLRWLKKYAEDQHDSSVADVESQVDENPHRDAV